MCRILNDMHIVLQHSTRVIGRKNGPSMPLLSVLGTFPYRLNSPDGQRIFQSVVASVKTVLEATRGLETCRICAARIRFRFLSRMDQAQGTAAPALVANLWRVSMSFFNPAGGRGTGTTARTRTCPPTVEPRPARPPPSATPTVTATCTTSRTRTAMTTSTTPNADGTEVRKGVRARIFNL